MQKNITYVEPRQVRTYICPHLTVIDLVSSPFRMFSEGAGPVAFVVIVRTLLGGEGEASNRALEDGSGLHRCVYRWIG